MKTQTIEALCEINPETLGGATPIDFEFRYLDISAVTKGRIDWLSTRTWKYLDAPSRARRVARVGDVLLCTVRPGLQAHARIVRDAPQPLVCSTGFAALRPKMPADSGFIFYQIFSDTVAAQLRALETGSSYPAVNESDVRRISFFTPEPDERARIANILDTLDAAIAHTEAIIAKLQQVRAGLLHDLLTRGLDDNGELRDPHAHPEQFQESPLGRIPKAWEVVPLSHLYKTPIRDFGSFSMTNLIDFSDSGVAFIKSEMIEEESLNVNGMMYISPAVHEQLRKSWVYPGNVLYSKIGSALGKALIYDGRFGICNSNAAVAKIDVDERLVLSQFVVILLNAEETKTRIMRSLVSLLPRLNLTDISNFEIPLPPTTEQKRIIEVTQSLSEQIKAEKEQFAKLGLLKSGLMSDLLTGKVRVPENIVMEC